MDKAKALAAALAGMTADQQRQHDYIVEFFNNSRDATLAKIAEIPPEWDGHELRELAYERGRRNVSSLMRDKRSKRYRSFESHCLTHNLF